MNRLQSLKDKTEATSYAEVLKEALYLYERLIELKESGRTFQSKDKTGNVTEHDIFIA